jgi:hypothetical protein
VVTLDVKQRGTASDGADGFDKVKDAKLTLGQASARALLTSAGT